MAADASKAHSQEVLLSVFQSLLASGEYSDLKITCNGAEWPVHRAVICSRSEWFKACCKNFKEAESGVIDLPDDNNLVVGALLRYLYTVDYDDEIGGEDFAPLLFSVHVHTIADKYGIPGLSDDATHKFATRAKKEWNTSAFADAIEDMYTTSPETKGGMREQAVDIAAEHIKTLRTSPLGARFRMVSDTVAPFASALLNRVINGKLEPSVDLGGLKSYRCPGCSKILHMDPADANSSSYNIRSCCYCSIHYQARYWSANELK